ncbi:hypothetical protein J5N97_011666 [Dioscorea zingiberensis]|uniref:Cysteine-rich receptor-like protein kinase 10 n=1 Tax=Dioscorea zingiberensis TaxID=325984 RepID=A0A9D5D1G7_9LILI|nr:hypothetical protein J5N97_011666 [Dioscorea zingiberensis]
MYALGMRNIFLVPLLTIFLLHLFLAEAYLSQINPSNLECDYSSNYTIPSPYKTNLDTLLSNLTATAPYSDALFYNNSVVKDSDAAYGLAQCRPNTSPDDCAVCLYRSALSFFSNCLFARSAAVWFDNCFFRYSDHRFFSQLDDKVLAIAVNAGNISNPMVFSQPLKELMYEVTSKAQRNETRFASASFNYSMFGNIYGIAECTRDLTDVDCSTCLNQSLPLLLQQANSGRPGCRVISFSCSLRFELYPILPPPLPPPPKSPNPTDNDDTDLTSGETKWFELSTLREATDNFSDQNKLGQGGFGPVYKGTLKDGQEIAVKRLSASSGQGMQELRNEVNFVAKLQHRNLVKLLGCCLEDSEKLLVYEYLPNTSLDKILFNKNGSEALDWSSRYKIIEGIARGLLYLHEDSRLRIIHRDMKASNILLDAEKNPKISDFGLAKHFGLNETQGNTNRIAGTYGYMAPEYLMHGEFSTKSDVFSYGVLVLEIVTGQKNRGIVRSRPAANLVSHVWRHWHEGTALELMDRQVGDGFPAEQVLRCMHVGLLCVQEDLNKRPSMASVVNMLSSYSTSLPTPLIPGFFTRSNTTMESDENSGNVDHVQSGERWHTNGSTNNRANPTSINEISLSVMEPR